MFKENHYIVIYNQFTYLTKSLGVSYNSIDDSFDYENRIFNVEVPEQNHEWFKVYPGDKFESLTVKEVSVDYDYFEGEVYNGDLKVRFSGKVTVTGLIKYDALNVTKSGEGSILLLVDGEAWGDIPILLLKSDIGYLQKADFEDNHNNFYYSSDLEAINLGNIYQEYYADFDFSMLPNDGSYLRAEVTLTDLLYWKKTRSTGMRYNAKIESISLLDE